MTKFSLLSFADQAADPASDKLPTHWEGVLCVEGLPTGDGRIFEPDAVTWETPMPLRFVKNDVGAHDGADVAGLILSVERRDDGVIWGTGTFDLVGDAGRESARRVRDGLMNGVSVDLDAMAYEVRSRPTNFSEDEEPTITEDGRVVIGEGASDDDLIVITSALIRAATLVSIPAFKDAKIMAVADGLVASASPIEPPRAWFTVPEPDAPTPLTITDDGQVHGHLATWGTCHIAQPGGKNECVTAPESPSNYLFFHVGVVKTCEGDMIPTGVLTFATKHAGIRANAATAAAHYDDTGRAGADIHAIDGKHGIWVCGALRPGVSAEDMRTLRASPLSGDWRWIDGQLELVGALAVNVPGFPIPRTAGYATAGEQFALVAAGMIPPADIEQFTAEDAEYLRGLIRRERESEAAAVKNRVQLAKHGRNVAALAAQRRIEKLKGQN